MEASGVPPERTYSAAIEACGRWEKAVSLLEVMRKESDTPNAVTLRSVLLALENIVKTSGYKVFRWLTYCSYFGI